MYLGLVKHQRQGFHGRVDFGNNANMIGLFFSAQGRITRARFWAAGLASFVFTLLPAGALFSIAVQPGSEHGSNVDPGMSLLLLGTIGLVLLLGAWSSLCIGIKRYHDRGKSGYWILVSLVPYVGTLWYLIEAGCLSGTDGPNQYGPDPQIGPTRSTHAYY